MAIDQGEDQIGRAGRRNEHRFAQRPKRRHGFPRVDLESGNDLAVVVAGGAVSDLPLLDDGAIDATLAQMQRGR